MNTRELNASILIVEESPESLHKLTKHLSNVGLDVNFVQSGENALDMIQKWVPEFILLNIRLPGIDGFETCRRLKQHEITQDVPILLIASTKETIDKTKCLTVGSLGCITKPFQYEEVLMHINVHLTLFRQQKILLQKNKQLQQEIKRLKSIKAEAKLSEPSEAKPYQTHSIIGESKPIVNILSEIRRLQGVNKTGVLIEGECGTGKELIARAIHEGGTRAKGPFIAVNCSAIPSELVESHFFGHIRGSFTGALNDCKGYFEVAEGGTLFLDEIGDMPMLLQAKLLRALEEKTIMPVGSTDAKPVDIRVIAATNANLLAMVQTGRFRRDLYFRLACYHITVPPLRTHKEDLALLASHFLEKLVSEMGGAKKKLSELALAALENYEFPGNVRELKNILERALIYCDDKTIEPQHLHFLETTLIKETRKLEPFQIKEALKSFETKTFIATAEEKIIAFVQTQGSINNAQCRQLLDANHCRASYLLGKLKRDGILVRRGTNRRTSYRLPLEC